MRGGWAERATDTLLFVILVAADRAARLFS
jgi:hypothetical protein